MFLQPVSRVQEKQQNESKLLNQYREPDFPSLEMAHPLNPKYKKTASPISTT